MVGGSIADLHISALEARGPSRKRAGSAAFVSKIVHAAAEGVCAVANSLARSEARSVGLVGRAIVELRSRIAISSLVCGFIILRMTRLCLVRERCQAKIPARLYGSKILID